MNKKNYSLVKVDTSTAKINIGKGSLTATDLSKANISKDKNLFRINIDENNSFTGNQITDQTASYLLLNVKKDSNLVEVMQINSWYQFIKDTKKSESVEEIEEKMKKHEKETQLLDNIIHNKAKALVKETRQVKGKTTNKHILALKEQEEAEEEEKNKKKDKNKTNEDSDDEVFKLKNKKKRKNSMDSMESVPSDLEKIISVNNQVKANTFENLKKELEEEDESSEDESDDLFGNNNEKQTHTVEDEDDDDFDLESLDKKDFLGKKREFDIPKQNVKASLENEINSIITKYRSISYDNLKKELSKNDMFTINDISDNLNLILDQKFSRFVSNGERLYCKKINK